MSKRPVCFTLLYGHS
ncbi:hypothetical protein EYZ11_009791 [Aspergillus tanneri]|uniref:Uncharacterized protein n=1 Tax=Aspergillus tanneri TaxID=1220188 RepID=A0A4V6RQQ2_9EURO|nr:hypothetical protein EYZ11_009791 [Aspergillus tanneri]